METPPDFEASKTVTILLFDEGFAIRWFNAGWKVRAVSTAEELVSALRSVLDLKTRHANV